LLLALGPRSALQFILILLRQERLIPVSLQDETEARRILDCWRRADNAASTPKGQHMTTRKGKMMSPIQKLFTALLPKKWAESMESESRAWILRCPCGFERSWWDAGGIRWKAAGQPRRRLLCPQCDRHTWHSTCKKQPATEPRELHG
jgi:hypothetical protein